MAVSRDTTTSHDITTDAGFRAWGQAVHDKLIAAGIVDTAATGSIDLTTVATPGVNSTVAGFKVYRFDDADQGSYPIFFKLEFGRGGGATRPMLLVTVGFATDGAGTITGWNSGQLQCTTSTTTPTASLVHAAHSHGCLVLACAASTTNPQLIYGFSIERPRFRDGAIDTGAAFLRVWSGGTSNTSLTGALVDRDGGRVSSFPGAEFAPTSIANFQGGTGVDGSDVLLGSFPMGRGHYGWSVCMAIARTGDITAGIAGATGTIEMIPGVDVDAIGYGANMGLASNVYLILNE